jgi:hypothetical protein
MSAELLRRDAVREERNDILHPILIGGEDLKRIADRIERSSLDPIDAEDDTVRIEAVGKIRGGPSRMTARPQGARNVPSRISTTGAASPSRGPQPVTASRPHSHSK